MDVAVTPAAPAAPVQPPAAAPSSQPATHAAVSTGSTADYRAARRAERAGKPLDPVTVTATADTPASDATPAAPAQPERPVSKRQEKTNDAIREAVDRATADLRAEVERLRAPRADTAAPAPPKVDAAPKEPDWKRYRAMPDAPKLEAFDSVEDHAAAMALFVADKRFEERKQADARAAHEGKVDAFERERLTTFDTRVEEMAKTDPDIVSKILPVAQEFGRRGGPFKAINDLVISSEVGPRLLRDHVKDLEALAVLPAHLRALPIDAQVRAHAQYITKEFGKLEGKAATPPAAPAAPATKTLTDAPDVKTLGTRPAEAADPKVAAVKSGSTRAYRELRRAERAAAMRR